MRESLAKYSYGDEYRPIYPFTAIVAQDELKMALILNAIDPSIGGILLTGPKGSGKSSIVRAMAEIFPEIDVVKDCVFGCNPFDQTKMCEECSSRFNKNNVLPKKRRIRVVTLPLSATEDRVIGSLDVEVALSKGVKALQPGILAEANQNILYIDEVNLLPDHLVDMILDASAAGWNTIEREGISITHPSSFVLVGSMNPEEGELRPQILDRFGLHVNAQRLMNTEERIEVIRRNEEFSENPLAFREKYVHQQAELRMKILAAKEILPGVQVSQAVMESVARICINLQVDGCRPDIVMVRTAKALAAFKNRRTVLPEDVFVASNLVLSHRTRKSGEKLPPTQQEIQKTLKATPIGREILGSNMGYLGKLGGLIPLDKVKRISPLLIIAGLILLLSIFFTSFFSVDLLAQS
jgi:Mg-chelatase subunit ChlI